MAKVTVEFNVPDSKAVLFLDAFCAELNYDPLVDGNKLAFFRLKVRDMVSTVIRDNLAKVRSNEAKAALEADITAFPITTN